MRDAAWKLVHRANRPVQVVEFDWVERIAPSYRARHCGVLRTGCIAAEDVSRGRKDFALQHKDFIDSAATDACRPLTGAAWFGRGPLWGDCCLGPVAGFDECPLLAAQLLRPTPWLCASCQAPDLGRITLRSARQFGAHPQPQYPRSERCSPA